MFWAGMASTVVVLLDARVGLVDEMKSRAVVVYLSVGRSSFPHCDPEAVIETFGAEAAESLMPYASAVASEVLNIWTDWSTHTLDSAGEEAAAQMRQRHPELDDEAIKALGWHFSYTYF
jgi:hypothetical protein